VFVDEAINLLTKVFQSHKGERKVSLKCGVYKDKELTECSQGVHPRSWKSVVPIHKKGVLLNLLHPDDSILYTHITRSDPLLATRFSCDYDSILVVTLVISIVIKTLSFLPFLSLPLSQSPQKSCRPTLL